MAKRFIDSIKLKKGEVNISLTLIGYRDNEERLFVLYSPALNLYSYGENEEEAWTAFDETIHLYIDHVIQENTIEKDLKKLGWKQHRHFRKRYNPPIYDPREIMSKKGVDSFNVIDKQLELQAS